MNLLQVLLLTAQFEAAVEFLSRVERLRPHAVHLAILLHESKALLTPPALQSQLLSREPGDPQPVRRLNFARLIMMYTRKFECTDAREALQYFYFLRGRRTARGDDLFSSCVSELVRETREFELLLGALGRDGSRKPGVLDKFQADTRGIIEAVARDTEDKGMLEDAVKLYDLAGKHERVLELLNKLLSQVASQPPSASGAKDRYQGLALGVAQRYRSLGHAGPAHVTATFYLLLDLLTFFDLYHTGKSEQAFAVMQVAAMRKMNIVP